MSSRSNQFPCTAALHLFDGQTIFLGHDIPAVDIYVRNSIGLKALGSLNQLAIIEAYMRGDIDIEGDLIRAMSFQEVLNDNNFWIRTWRWLDARIVENGEKVVLVVQTCVSPASGARTKVLKTVKELIRHQNLPRTLVYCTSATIKLALDETTIELRREHDLTLKVHDAQWLCAREHTPTSRAAISHSYAAAIFEPLLREVDANRLYSGVLSADEERIAIQYLEAQTFDRVRGGNLTKQIYDAFVIYATRDSNPPKKVFTQQQIIDGICSMFPDGQRERINT